MEEYKFEIILGLSILLIGFFFYKMTGNKEDTKNLFSVLIGFIILLTIIGFIGEKLFGW
jgi:hypothetical protein